MLLKTILTNIVNQIERLGVIMTTLERQIPGNASKEQKSGLAEMKVVFDGIRAQISSLPEADQV